MKILTTSIAIAFMAASVAAPAYAGDATRVELVHINDSHLAPSSSKHAERVTLNRGASITPTVQTKHAERLNPNTDPDPVPDPDPNTGGDTGGNDGTPVGGGSVDDDFDNPGDTGGDNTGGDPAPDPDPNTGGNDNPVSDGNYSMNKSIDELRADIFVQINEYRASKGLVQLSIDDCASFEAQKNAVENATRGNGSIEHSAQICNPAGGEIAAANSDPSSSSWFVQAWHLSTSHRGIMQSTTARKMGVGVAQDASGRWYSTVLFLRADAADNVMIDRSYPALDSAPDPRDVRGRTGGTTTAVIKGNGEVEWKLYKGFTGNNHSKSNGSPVMSGTFTTTRTKYLPLNFVEYGSVGEHTLEVNYVGSDVVNKAQVYLD